MALRVETKLETRIRFLLGTELVAYQGIYTSIHVAVERVVALQAKRVRQAFGDEIISTHLS
jgi:hypothetical protein